MQLWPAKEKRVRGERRGGAVGASAQTITGVALPSSSADVLARRALLQLPADVAGAGEGHRSDALVLDQDVTDLRRRAGDDVEPPGRQPAHA